MKRIFFHEPHALPVFMSKAVAFKESTPRHGGPDAMDVVVIVEMLEKFADLGLLFRREGGNAFREVTHFAGHHGPAVL